MKEFIISKNWEIVSVQAELIDWQKYSSIAFSRGSQDYHDFKSTWDELFNADKPRGITYTRYVKLISTAKGLGLF